MDLKEKTNLYGGLERCKVRWVIRGDRTRKGHDFDETRTATHMPSQAGRRVLLAGAVANKQFIEIWDVLGAYMRSPGDPIFRMDMKQPPRPDVSFKAPGKIYLMRKAMQGKPSAGAQWS